MPRRTDIPYQFRSQRGCPWLTNLCRPNGSAVWVGALLSLLTLSAQGFWKAEPLPAIDRRLERPTGEASTPTPSQLAAAQLLQSRLPSARLDFDSLRQSPVYVRCLDGCLTGAGGAGKGVSLQSLENVPAAEAHRPLKVFLQEASALYGHGPEVIRGVQPIRETISRRNGLRTVVWEQRCDDVPVFESVLIGHITSRDELLAVSSTFMPNMEALAAACHPDRKLLLERPSIDVSRAIVIAAAAIQDPVAASDILPAGSEPVGAERQQQFRAPPLLGTVSARLTWLPLRRDEVTLCWRIELTRRERGERYQVLVDTRSGEVLIQRCLTLYLQDATYQVFTSDSPSPLSPGLCTPSTFQPALLPRTWVTLAAKSTNASPLGWIAQGENETRGNNVDSHLDLNADDFPDLPRPQGNPFRVFGPDLDLSRPAEENADASVVQLFYWCNFMHDCLYDLGFDEASGNYQKDNLGRGGRGGDPILADAQDGSGVNNANFTPSPDGEPGRIQMFVFDGPEPSRDGDLDAEIVLHEYTHGLSTRLVGGGVGITTLQGGGLGEGWSDFYALALLGESSDDPDACYAMGAYVTKNFFGLEENYYYGIRRYPYSTDLTKNPLTFKDIDPSQISEHTGIPRSPVFPFSRGLAGEVHNQGEVWCVTLWEARSLLIKKHGFEIGSRLILELVTEGMKLSPPNPNFLQARDAILQADLVNHRALNQPELWAAFAKRGMGFSAESPVSTTTAGVREGFDLPDSLGLGRISSLVFSGQQSGPFFSECRSIALTNHADIPLHWTAGAERAEFEIRPPSGVLPPHGQIAIQICLTDSARQLPIGRFLDTLSVTNLNTGIVQRRTLDIRVLQFATMPFSDDFEGGDLRPEWLVAKPKHGRVEPTSLGGPYAGHAHLLMDSNSDGLPARNELTLGVDMRGWTNVVLRFWAREFNDEPNPPPPGLFEDGADFDGVAISIDGISWVEVQGLRRLNATNQEVVVQLDGPVAQYGFHYGEHFQIRFNQFDNYPLPLDGIAIDDVVVSGTPYRRFSLELPPALIEGTPTNHVGAVVLAVPATEDVVFALFTDRPQDITPSLATVIRKGETRGEFLIKAGDNRKLDGTRSVLIRAVGVNYHGDPAWLSVEDDETATLTLSVPAEVTEGSGTQAMAGRVNVSRMADNNLTVGIRSSHPRKLLLPSSVTIPSGESTTTFDIVVLDGKEIEGPVDIQIFAEVAGWETGVAGMKIHDNDEATLALVLPISVSEGNPPVPATIVLGGTVGTNVVVTLTSLDPANVSLAKTVTVQAGKSSVTFELNVIDDTLIEGPHAVTVRAEAPLFTSAAASFIVLDDETPPKMYDPTPKDGASNQPPRLELRWRPGFGELLVNGDFETGDLRGWETASASGRGFVVDNGEINPDGPDTPAPAYEGEFYALLAQDAPGTHVMWQDVSIPDDAKSALLSWFDFIHNHGSEYFDPLQQYRVEIQNPEGKVLAVAFATKPGDPVSIEWTRHEFDLTPFRGQTIRLMFAEQDDLGFINVGIDKVSLELGTTGLTEFEVFVGMDPSLGAAARVGRVDTNAFFLSRLSPRTEYFWQVAAIRGEALTLSPVWRFETRSVGQLDHFGWDPIPSNLEFGNPVNVRLAAQDEFGLTVTNFAGRVELRCSAGPQSADTVLITEVDPGRDDQAEFTNVSPGPVDVGGWRFAFFDLTRWPNPKRILTAPRPTIVHRGETFTIREGGKGPGTYPDFRLGTNVNWGFLTVGQPIAVLVQDAAGNFVDFVSAVDADPKLIVLPMPLPLTAWSGSSLLAITSQSNTWQRIGKRNHHSDQDWVVADRNFGSLNPDLQLPFEAAAGIPIAPSQVTDFTNGIWSGTLQLDGVGPILVLSASDDSGHVGSSEEFAIAARNDLAVDLLDKPAAVFLDQEITLRYAVTNSGPAAADDVQWSIVIPQGVDLVSNESSQGTWEPTPDGLRCRLGRLPGGTAAILSLKWTASNPGRYTNQCSVSSASPDGFLANNHLETVYDVILPLLVISDTTVQEGTVGTNLAAFRVRLSAPIRREVRVHFHTEDDGATAGQDYIDTSGILIFPPGSTNQTLSVPVIGDALYEVQERIIVRLESPVQALLGDAEARCTILEEEVEPKLIVDNVTVIEGSGERGTAALVPVRLTGQNSREVSLTYFTVDQSARGVSDYLARRGQLVFRVGETQHQVMIPIVADLRPEPPELFSLVLTNASGAGVAKGEGFITITDDDAAQMSSLSWSSIAPTQRVQRPFLVTLTARDSTGQIVTGFGGRAKLRAFTARHESGPKGESNLWEFPLRTYFHDARSQFLYRSEELGARGMIGALKLPVNSIPGQTLRNFTLRIKSSHETEFTGGAWENSGWTTVIQRDLLVTDPGELVLPLESPFPYDGINSILIDVSFDNSSYTYDGFCPSVETQEARGRVFESDSAFGSPLDWEDIFPPANLVNRVAEILFVIDRDVPILPQVTGLFVAGVWEGELTVLSEATEVVIEASSSEQIITPSEAFSVVHDVEPPRGPRITRLDFKGNDLVVEFVGEDDHQYQLEAAERLAPDAWTPVGAQGSGSPAGTAVTDIGGASHARRFYRVRQLP